MQTTASQKPLTQRALYETTKHSSEGCTLYLYQW